MTVIDRRTTESTPGSRWGIDLGGRDWLAQRAVATKFLTDDEDPTTGLALDDLLNFEDLWCARHLDAGIGQYRH